MKTFKDLLRTETYWITRIQNELFNAVEAYLEANNMTRTEFARQLGVSKGYISQVLNGEFNHRLSKLIELALAIGKAPMLELEDLDEVVEKEGKGMMRRRASYVPRAPFSIRVEYGRMEEEELKRPGKKQRLPYESKEEKAERKEGSKRTVVFYSPSKHAERSV